MATVQDILGAIAPEVVATVTPLDLSVFLDLAEARVGSVFGARRNEAVAYMAAHLMTLAGRRVEAAGAITAESEGQLSRSYHVEDSGGEPSLSSTSYGLEFRTIRRSCVLGFRNRTISAAGTV